MLTTSLLIILGLFLGIVISAPVGPVNVLCIQRTLQHGFWGGVATGLGAVIGDGILASAAAFGIKAISGVFVTHELYIEIIGGLILLAFGIRLFFIEPAIAVAPEQKSALSNNATIIPRTLFLTVTNPGAFFGIFTLFGWVEASVGGLDEYVNSFVLVVSVMGGSLLWWCGLSWLIAKIRHCLNEERLSHINRAAAAILILFSILLFAQINGTQ
ncbi:MAG: LysE family transporter [Pseudomonadota bacterium]